MIPKGKPNPVREDVQAVLEAYEEDSEPVTHDEALARCDAIIRKRDSEVLAEAAALVREKSDRHSGDFSGVPGALEHVAVALLALAIKRGEASG